MINFIQKINQDLENYTSYYEMANYFRKDDTTLSNIFMNICSYQLNYQMDGLANTLQENFITKEMKDEDIECLSSMVENITNIFLKARIYHFLFIKRKKKNRNDAIQTVQLYWEISQKLSSEDNFHELINYLFIALYIGNLVHIHNTAYDSAKNKLLDFLKNINNQDIHKSIYALSFVNWLQILPKENIISTAQDISNNAISLSEHGQAILALEIAKDNYRHSEVDNISELNRKMADCYIYIARSDSGLRAAHFLLKAISVLRCIKDTREERLSLYEEMRDYQRESMLDLKYCETPPFDISPLLEQVRGILQESQDLFDMLFRTSCCIIDIAKMETIKNAEINTPKSFIDIFYGQRMYIDHQGIPINTNDIPSIIDFGNITDNEKNILWSKMVEKIKIHHQVSCVAIAEALRVLNSTYYIEYQYILYLCKNTPFVPNGHEEFFAKGIIAGLNGDFLTASHLLVPQIENSLRHLLELGAEEPTTLHANNEQERDGLKALLENPEIIRIFGIDGVVHLRTILLDKRYPSLRHSIAHGLIDSSHFYGTGSIYLWWLVLRIVMVPYKKHWEAKYSPDGAGL